MAGPVPAIHVFDLSVYSEVKTRMPGTADKFTQSATAKAGHDEISSVSMIDRTALKKDQIR
jgi:hypothetical protein